jgi:hypothetical protein
MPMLSLFKERNQVWYKQKFFKYLNKYFVDVLSFSDAVSNADIASL